MRGIPLTRASRKADHLRLASKQKITGRNGLDDIRFVHFSLPEINYSDTSLAMRIGELEFSSPILINAMTGGSEKSRHINEALARVAARTGVAMAVGSQRAALEDPAWWDSYAVVRKMNPRGIVLANLGADASVEEALRAIEMVRADALQLHLNVPQELVMAEGERSFRGMIRNIEQILLHSPVPVIIKEVGFGLSRETCALLADLGVQWIDVGGRGGTDFVRIENERRRDRPIHAFEDWGQTTAVSLLEVNEYLKSMHVIASGGIRHALDMAKSLALGASLVGVAGGFLRVLQQKGEAGLEAEISHWHEELRLLMTALGCGRIADLHRVPLVITGSTAEWCRARGIAMETFADRRFLLSSSTNERDR